MITISVGTHKALCLAVFVTSVVLASQANADLMLSGSISSQSLNGTFCAKDQFGVGSCPDGTSVLTADFDPTVGILQNNFFFGLTNTFIFVSSADLSQPTPTLTLAFSSLVNDTSQPITLHLTISQTNFAAPISQTTQTASGTFQVGQTADPMASAIALAWYVDPLNAQGAEALNDLPGILLDTFSTSAQTTSSFSHSDSDLLAINNPYSMTLSLSFTIRPGVSVTNFSQRLTATLAPTNGTVPAPGSFVLLMLGLACLGATRRALRTK